MTKERVLAMDENTMHNADGENRGFSRLLRGMSLRHQEDLLGEPCECKPMHELTRCELGRM